MDERAFHDQFYEREAQRIFSSPLYRALLDLHVEFLIDAIPNLASVRMLSIGCGDGRRELALARYAGHIVGFDASGVAIRNARREAVAAGIHNVEFHVGDANGFEHRFGSPFDVVLCAGVLHHLPDREIGELLRGARSALKPGGRFISMDPSSRRAVNVLKPLLRRTYERYHSPDERELRPGAVAEMLRLAGYHTVEIHFSDAFISPLAWAFPGVPEPLAPVLVWLDRLLRKTPALRQLSSGFAAVARRDG